MEALTGIGDVTIVTCAVSPNAAAGKLRWFRRHLVEPGILGPDALIITCDKSRIRGDLIVDDRPKFLGDAAADGTRTFCVGWPWNRNHPSDYRAEHDDPTLWAHVIGAARVVCSTRDPLS